LVTSGDGLQNVIMLRRTLAVLAIAPMALLSACGDDEGPDVERSYEVELRMDDSTDGDYKYVAVGEVPDFRVGDEVTFVVDNGGTLIHDLQVQAPDGDVVAVAPAINPGETLELTAFLGQVGIYRLNCLVDDHLTQHDMQTLIEVDPLLDE
jgi:uncharacterized cupredoxin-like copper-binding protein